MYIRQRLYRCVVLTNNESPINDIRSDKKGPTPVRCLITLTLSHSVFMKQLNPFSETSGLSIFHLPARKCCLQRQGDSDFLPVDDNGKNLLIHNLQVNTDGHMVCS